MTFTLALLVVLGLVGLVLVAISDWQQVHRPVSTGHGPANHRSTVLIGG